MSLTYQNAATFIITNSKDSKNVKTLILCLKMQSISVFLDITKVADFW